MELKKQEMLDKNISENPLTRFGVRRPHTVFVMIMVIIILGFFAFSSMNAELFPNMNIPFVVVISSHEDPSSVNPLDPLAMAATLEITEEIEARMLMINGVDNIQTMTTAASVITFIEFSTAVDINTAYFEVTMSMLGMGNFLVDRNFLQQPMAFRLDPNMLPVLTFSSSFVILDGSGDIDESATINWYNDIFVPQIRTVPGVAQINGAIIGTPRPVSFADMPGFAYVNNEPSFSFSIQQTSGAVTTQVVPAIISAIDQLRTTHPNFEIRIQMDQAEIINDSIGGVLNNLLIGGALAVLILFLFLRNWKLTVAVGLSIPLSVVGTFILMYFLGITINIVSLAGLALAVGMLIDNSIIVVENTFRLRAKGMSVKDAAIKGASQIFGAIVAATLTTMAVFVPMFFVSGMMMEVFMDMVYVIMFALFASLVSAVMFLPSIISAFKIKCNVPRNCPLATDTETKEKAMVEQSTAEAEIVQPVQPTKSPGFGAKCKTAMGSCKGTADRWYNSALKFTIKQKWLTLGVAIVAFVGSIFLAGIHGFELMPAEDTGTFTVNVQTNPTYNILNSTFDTAHDITTANDGLYHVTRQTLGNNAEQIAISFGGGMMGMMGGGSSIAINVTLTDNRSISTVGASQLLYAAVTQYLENNNMLLPPGTPMLASGGYFASGVGISAGGMNAMAADSVVVTLTAPIGDNIAVSMAALQNAINLVADELIDVEGVHRVTHTFNQFSITRVNRHVAASVTATIVDGYNIGHVQQRVDSTMADLRANNAATFNGIGYLDDGFGAQFNDTITQMGIALLVGLLLMYLVMVAIFRSFKSPFIMLITIPLGFTGGFLFLAIFGMPISMVAMIGLLLLMGVIINNGIVLVDYINQARDEGLSVRDAVIAGANTRIRPIMMLSITTIMAMLPMAFGFGPSGELMQPMAIVTIGGLVYATIMSLLVVPAFYVIFNKDKKQKPVELETNA
ncbi:MAG: efflux RND transporter permease subunit [Firmicutes bacterium]|nr:efflux RND transporter permease subunit [Bacillota bacterium]